MVYFVKAAVTPCRIALTNVRQRAKFSLRSSPFTCISCPFLVRQMRSLSGEVRSIRRKVLCMHKTWNGLYRAKPSAGCTFVVRWHAFCSELVRSSSCTCQFASVDVRWTRLAAGLLPDMQRVNRRCARHVLYKYVRRTFCQFLMCSVFVPLLVRWCVTLACTCPVIVRSLCILSAPYSVRESLEQQRRRLSPPDNLFSQSFYPSDVR